MAQIDVTVRVAGENGEGVLSVGEVLAEALGRTGLHVYTFKNLPAEIKGGASMVQVRLSDDPVRSPGDGVDVLMVWNRENYDIHMNDLRPGGVLLYDPDECPLDGGDGDNRYPVPLNKITKEEIKQVRSKNVLAFGVLTSFLGVPIEVAEKMIAESRWGRRKQFMESNLLALRAGYRYVSEHVPYNTTPMPELNDGQERSLVLTGNQAICLGAVVVGCQYYAGYPITPASDIMEELAKLLPGVGGVVVQTEDEIAALASVIGASYAGRKAMTATAGPGLSLMVEQLGLAAMLEIPLVVVDAQRGGPSTGLPTKTEQSDLDLALYGRHGDAPRIVLAPFDVEDCFYTTIQAFNLAEKYQTPVLLLSDQHLSQRTEAIPRPALAKIEVTERRTPSPEGLADYQRYRLTDDSVSPMAIPGLHDAPYVATGLEHNEHAYIDYSPRMHVLMGRKRAEKIAKAAQEPGFIRWLGPKKDADLGLIAWGSSAGPVIEALPRAEAKGYRVAALFPKMLSPLPLDEIQRFVDAVRQVAVVELNYSGQFAYFLQSQLCRPFLRLNKYTGLPFKAVEVLDYIEELLKNG